MELFVWTILLPLGASPFIYVVGRATNNENRYAQWLALATLAVTLVIFGIVAADGGAPVFELNAMTLQFDGIAQLVAGLTLGLGALVVLYSGSYMAGEEGEEKYYALLVAMIGVIVGLACATDLFNLWLWFEAMAITSYFLVAFYRNQPTSLEAGVKYLIQSASGSVLVITAIALIFAQTGTTDIGAIRTAAAGAALDSTLMLAAGALFVIGFGVKAALVPMHTWLPDAHSQAPSGISAMLSGVVIEGGLIAMLRALTVLGGFATSWGALLMLFGAANMVIGNLLALRQTQVKRMLAFSSLTHMGYMLIGLGVGIYAGELAGAQGGFFHMLSHGMMKGLAFLAAGTLLYTLHISLGDHEPLVTSDLNGAAQRYPVTALALSVAVLGLAGLPPLVGFMSKWQIFVGGIAIHNTWVNALLIFAALNSVLSLAYYAPVVNALYRKQPSLVVTAGQAVPVSFIVPLALLLGLVALVGFWPDAVTWITEPAGMALVAAFGG